MLKKMHRRTRLQQGSIASDLFNNGYNNYECNIDQKKKNSKGMNILGGYTEQKTPFTKYLFKQRSCDRRWKNNLEHIPRKFKEFNLYFMAGRNCKNNTYAQCHYR